MPTTASRPHSVPVNSAGSDASPTPPAASPTPPPGPGLRRRAEREDLRSLAGPRRGIGSPAGPAPGAAVLRQAVSASITSSTWSAYALTALSASASQGRSTTTDAERP